MQKQEKTKLPDYYAVLGVPREATESQIRKGYHQMKIAYHPDKHTTRDQSAQAEMSKQDTLVNTAYETLKDPEKK